MARAASSFVATAACLVVFALCISRALAGDCRTCNLPASQGGCKCNSNCDCISGNSNGNKCDKCNIPVAQGGCKCNSNCDCVSNGGSNPSATPSSANKCDKCNLPRLNGGCQCNANCDCVAAAKGCTIKTYGRGVGVPLNACPDGQEQSGALCYPPCASGFRGVGPVCWPDCPSGFTDIGAFCQKPGSYGRGAGYAAWDWDKCTRENKQGCEWNLAMIYPKCAPGFHAVGCCVCSPDCPANMPDTGTGCRKNSYGRSAGSAMWCSKDTEQNGALCYPKCAQGYKGVGPVCWADFCPSTGNTEKCMGFFCVTPGSCGEITAQFALFGVEAASLVKSFVECAMGNILSCIGAVIPTQSKANALQFVTSNFPNCS